MSCLENDILHSWATHIDPIFRCKRQQFAETFPVLAVVLARYPDIPVHMEIRTAIDRGLPFVNVLSDMLGISPSSICFLRNKPLDLVGENWVKRPADLLQAIELIPLDKLPKSRRDWEILWAFWSGFECSCDSWTLLRPPSSVTLSPVIKRVFAEICIEGYENSARQLYERWGDDFRRLAGVIDYENYFIRWCALLVDGIPPSNSLRQTERERLAEEILARYSAMDLIDQSDQWRREVRRVSSLAHESRSDRRLAQWPALPGLPLVLGDLVVVSLTSEIQLLHDSVQLGHRVEDYPDVFYFSMNDHFVSIRRRSGEVLSMAELRIHVGKRGKVRIEAGRPWGYLNELPGNECEAALSAVLAMLQAPAMLDQLQAFFAFNMRRRAELDASGSSGDMVILAEQMSEVMSGVLPDYDEVLVRLGARTGLRHA